MAGESAVKGVCRGGGAGQAERPGFGGGGGLDLVGGRDGIWVTGRTELHWSCSGDSVDADEDDHLHLSIIVTVRYRYCTR
jgi:hypothetical protein